MNMVILKGPEGVRLVPCNKTYRLLPNENIVGSATLFDKAKHEEQSEIEKLGITGLGDAAAAIIKTTGFKDWFNKMHGGECLPCKQRQAALNYFQFKGPKWLSKWVNKSK